MKSKNIEWSEEIRSFIETRLKQLELEEAIEEAGKRAEVMRVQMDSTGLIREGRDP